MSTPDRFRPAPYLAGLAGAAAVGITGVRLVVAPFAVGYQPEGADFVDATIIGVATGAALTVLGLVAVIVLATGVRAEAARRGLFAAPEREQSSTSDALSGDDDGSVDEALDLQTVLASLSAALLEDLRDGHEAPRPPARP